MKKLLNFKSMVLIAVLIISLGITTAFAAGWAGEMEPTTLTLEVGEKGTVVAKQTGDLLVNTLPTYVSSDTSIATVEMVNGKGIVTGIKAGTATITGKYGGKVAGTTEVTVKQSKWTGEMTPKTLTLKVGEQGTVKASQVSSLVVSTLPSYESSDTSVATVSDKGVVTGVKAGKATITGKYGNMVAGTTEVTVTKASGWEGRMTPTTLSLKVGEKGQVVAEQTGDLLINTLPTYVSSDESIATVDDKGIVTGIKAGKATITGKYGGRVAGTTEVTVTKASGWEGRMTPETLSLKVGEQGKVVAEQIGELVVNTLPTYVSSDTSIATVDDKGIVTGIKVGKATITGKYGGMVAGTTEVTVTQTTEPQEEWEGEMTPSTLKLEIGEQGTVRARQISTIVVDTFPTYESSDTSIATVDSKGVVTGIKAGKATITGRFGKDLIAGTTKVTVKEKSSVVGSSSGSENTSNDVLISSDWAKDEINKANKKGLIPEKLKNEDLTKVITRKEFAYVVVKLWETITGKTASVGSNNPFVDTNDQEVLKAYNLEITNGTSETTFSPDSLITREQMATMMTRALTKAGINTAVDLEKVNKFADDEEMHDWGKASVYYMSNLEIIKGVGDNKFGVTGNATREQSILISDRSIEKSGK